MNNNVSRAAATLGAKGGKAGRGKSKVRGDSEHYRRIVERRWTAARARRPEPRR